MANSITSIKTQLTAFWRKHGRSASRLGDGESIKEMRERIAFDLGSRYASSAACIATVVYE